MPARRPNEHISIALCTYGESEYNIDGNVLHSNARTQAHVRAEKRRTLRYLPSPETVQVKLTFEKRLFDWQLSDEVTPCIN